MLTAKEVLITKRLVMKEMVIFADEYFKFAEKVKTISSEAGISPRYMIDWALAELDTEIAQDKEESEQN